jgi:hypothetical protein
MKTMKMFLFGIVLLACFAVFLPSSVFATITIGTPGFNKDKVYEQEQVVFMVPIVSDNDVTSASVVIKNITLDSTNISSTSNKTYTLTRIGSATNGNWIYFFTLGPGIYQLSKAIATDNTSLIQSRDFEEGITYAFKVLASSTTSTTTTTAATSATTTTNAATTQTTTTSSTTSITTTTAPATILEKLFSNPIYIVAISLVIVVPVILMIIILTKKPEVTSVPENAESSGGSGKSDESRESNKSSESQTSI